MLLPSQQQHAIDAGSPFRVSITASLPPTVVPVNAPPAKPDESTAVHKPAKTAAIAPRPAQQQNTTSKQHDKNNKPVEQTQVTSQAEAQVETTFHVNTSATAFTVSAVTTSLLRAELHRAFLLKFYYPRLAQKRGWQGEVTLGLKLAANGKLENIKVLRSSGYGLLDSAALESLGKVEVLPAAVALLKGHEMKLELPVQYRLL